MNLFNSEKNKQMIDELAKAQSDFEFDQIGGKKQLLAVIENIQPEDIKSTSAKRPFILQFGLTLAAVILMVSGTFAVAKESLPGDKLFSVNKFKEKMLLILPLSPQYRAEIQASIVEDRLKALDQFPLVESAEPIKPDIHQLETRKIETLKEAEKSLNEAVDSIQKKRDELAKKGQTKQAEKLDEVLSNISEKAGKREKVIEEIERKIEEDREEVKEKVRESLEDLKKAQAKARTLKRSNNRN